MSTSKTTINTVAANSGIAPRAFLSAFRTRMQSVGFTLTPDTGQIDEATLTVPSSTSNLLWGHKIFRTPDTDPLHANLPIWMKMRFRTQAGSNLYDPTVYPHFGIGSDGVGNLDKLWMPLNDGSWPQICAPNSNSLMYLIRNNFMGGWFIGGLEGDSYDDTAGGCFYHRTVDENGNPTDEGFYALTFSNPSHLLGGGIPGGYYHQSSFATNSWITAYSVGVSNQNIYALPVTENYYDRPRGKWRGEMNPHGGGHKAFRILDVSALGLDDGKVLHYPFQGNKFDSIDRPLVGLIAYNRAFHTVGDTFTLDRYGINRTFMATPLRIASSLGGNQKIDYHLGILWE